MCWSKGMFTGLVETVAEILDSKPTSGGVRLRIGSSLARELAPGDSLAVNGVCLTVVQSNAAEIEADEAAIVAGQPSDLQGDRVGGDQRGGGHPHQSDDCCVPGTIAASQPQGDR